MKIYKLLFTFLIILLSASLSVFAQQKKTEEVCYNPNQKKDTTKKSIKSMAFAIFNGDSLKINYHSPGVRNRIIWGGLVPYNEVWVTGAHDATTIEFNKTIVVEGKEIPAGKYAFFTIPGKKEWTLIINKNWKQHLATEYDETEDIIRIKVKAKKNVPTERLQYFIEELKGDKVRISVAWEKLLIGFEFQEK